MCTIVDLFFFLKTSVLQLIRNKKRNEAKAIRKFFSRLIIIRNY